MRSALSPSPSSRGRRALFLRCFGWVLVGLFSLGLAACKKSTEIIVFHAASLRHVLADAAVAFHRKHPTLTVRLEPSGSQVAVRKITELGLKCDLIVLADAALIEKMMVPNHAAWSLDFATNEIVLAHGQHSRYTDEITAANWPEILQRPGVRLGRTNPDTAPIGYRTLLAWQLAEKSGIYKSQGEDLTARLTRLVPEKHISVDESELLAFLESKSIEYAFIYRSTAEDHRLKFVELPAAMNLSSKEMADAYSKASVAIRMKQAENKSVIRGAPITYGLTIPRNAPHPQASQLFVEFLLGPEGQALSKASGFKPLAPALTRQINELPEGLRRWSALAR
jgi:molybdate/tungstate transport system substrate-binding protein